MTVERRLTLFQYKSMWVCDPIQKDQTVNCWANLARQICSPFIYGIFIASCPWKAQMTVGLSSFLISINFWKNCRIRVALYSSCPEMDKLSTTDTLQIRVVNSESSEKSWGPWFYDICFKSKLYKEYIDCTNLSDRLISTSVKKTTENIFALSY